MRPSSKQPILAQWIPRTSDRTTPWQRDENQGDCMAVSGASRILRPGRLGAPFSVPPLTRPAPPRPLLGGFHRRELSLGDLLNRSCVGGPTGLKIFPVTNS